MSFSNMISFKKYFLLSISIPALLFFYLRFEGLLWIQRKYLRYNFQQSVKFGKTHRETKSLIFSIHQFNHIAWEEKGKEFRFDGKMFDVIKIIKDGKFIRIVCLEDKKEKELTDYFKKLLQHDTKQSLPSDPVAQKNFAEIFWLSFSPHEFHFHVKSTFLAFGIFITFYQSIKLQLLSPPPEI